MLNHQIAQQVTVLTCLSLLLATSGCATLASLGLPTGGNNKILEPAKAISEAPGQSLLLPKELAKQPLPVYMVEIGDTVLIESVNFDATIRLPSDQVIQPDGRISLGEFGPYLATGKTIEQIQTEVQQIIDYHLRQHLEIAYELERRERQQQNNGSNRQAGQQTDLALNVGDENPQLREALERRIQESVTNNEISARLISWDSKKVYVLGEVNSPGSFLFKGNETVLDAIIEAGGINSRANRHEIIISRPSSCNDCRTVIKVCYDHIVQLGDASTNYQLRPGDRVFIPSLTFKQDLRNTLGLDKHDRCPRCAAAAQGCCLPQGCE